MRLNCGLKLFSIYQSPKNILVIEYLFFFLNVILKVIQKQIDCIVAFSHYQPRSINQSLQFCITCKLAEVGSVPPSGSLVKMLNSTVPSINPCRYAANDWPPGGLCATDDSPLLLLKSIQSSSCEICVLLNTSLRTLQTWRHTPSSRKRSLVVQDSLLGLTVAPVCLYKMPVTHRRYLKVCIPWFSDWL